MIQDKGGRFDRNPGQVIRTWKRRDGERVVVSRSDGYGKRFHFRVWMRNGKGAYYPTRSGITFSISELQKLRRALKKAIEVSAEG